MEHAGGDGSGDGDGERRGAGRGRGRTNWAPTQQHQQEHLRRPRHTNNANQSRKNNIIWREIYRHLKKNNKGVFFSIVDNVPCCF